MGSETKLQLGLGSTIEGLVGMEVVRVKVDVACGAVGETLEDDDLVLKDTKECSQLQLKKILVQFHKHNVLGSVK
jgi:hypothetical protein